MEAVSAIGVAAAALQFVDFGTRLLSATRAYYRSPSGQTTKEVEVSTIANDLSGMLAQIREAATEDQLDSPAQVQLLKLAHECDKIIVQLQEALGLLAKSIQEKEGTTKVKYEKMEEKRGVWIVTKSFRRAIQAVWSEDRIKGAIETLGKLRQRIMMATLFCLWDESKYSKQRELQFGQRLDEMIGILKQIDARTGKTTQETEKSDQDTAGAGLSRSEKLSEDVIDVLNDRAGKETQRIQEELVSYLWDPKWNAPQYDITAPETQMAKGELAQDDFRAAIIDSLRFETMTLREESIPEAFRRTFSWIFLEEPSRLDGKSMWSSFPKWLRSETGRSYWITGKPGSGKSTLVKFIAQNPELRMNLEQWADGSPLLVTSYYAWIAGSSLQKSCEGLMRSLLYQILQTKPVLVPCATARRWALLTTLRRAAGMPPWKSWEIAESFDAVLSQCGKVMKLALFVDGLDEFELPPVEVLDLIRRINAHDGIKICVASRQWTEFNDALKHNPMLRMQDLTTPDMTYFVQSKLESNPGFVEQRIIFPRETSNLVKDIVKKSSGVFLWVSIVVRALLEALREGDGLAELQDTIDSLPSDIAQLYDSIWARISGRNISASSQLLVVFKSAHGPLHYLTMWLADEKQSLAFDINSLPPGAKDGVADLMKRRLDSRTRGILEISQSGVVDFLHRTARDWTAQPAVWERITSTIVAPFDPYLLLLKAETLRVADETYLRNNTEDELWAYINRSLWYASQVQDSSENRAKLPRILALFNTEVDKIADRYVRMDGWLLKAQSASLRPHWSSSQSKNSLGNWENTFLGLAVQFCILTYLRAKFPADLEAAKLKLPKNSVSLLENAVLGHSGVTDPIQNSDDPGFHVPQASRLETVAFLLEKGANPKQLMSSGSPVADMVKARVAALGDDTRPQEATYWAAVEGLLAQNKRGSKRGWRSMFKRTSKP